jgi:hypothetical protein
MDNNTLIRGQLSDWSEAFDWAIENVNKKIIEWPPGWEVVDIVEDPQERNRNEQ